MEKYTQKQLKGLVKAGAAVDISHALDINAIPEPYTKIGYAESIYGYGGMLLRGCETGNLYAVTSRTQAIYIFLTLRE